MATPPRLAVLKETDLQIKDGPTDGRGLRETFRRLFSSVNPWADGLNKLAAKGVTLADNLRCDIVSGKFTHGVAQQVALTTLAKAGSCVVLGADGQLPLVATVSMQQQTTQPKPLATVTIWFNDSTAANANCTLLLLPEGQQTSTTPTFLEAIPKSILSSVGALIYASAVNTPAAIAAVASGALLRTTGVGAAPAYYSTPMLEAASAAGQVIGAAATAIIVFGTVTTDTDSAYNASTGRFTVPTGKGGDYHISAGISLNTTQAGAINLGVYKNAAISRFIASWNTQTASTSLTGSVTVRVAAGDILDIRMTNNGAGGQTLLNNANAVYLSIKQVA